MADEYSTKRIINLPAESGPAEGDVFVVDNETTGTKKLPVEEFVDVTISKKGKAADANVTGKTFDGIAEDFANAFKTAINMFRGTLTQGMINASGIIVNSAGSIAFSRKIPVVGGSTVVAVLTYGESYPRYGFWAQFKSDGSLLSRGQGTGTNINAKTHQYYAWVTTSTDCAYVQPYFMASGSNPLNAGDYSNPKLHYGTAPNDLVNIIPLYMHSENVHLLTTTAGDICGSDLNNLPNNRHFAINITDGSIAHAPITQMTGRILTYGKDATRSVGDMHIFYHTSGSVYFRIYWSGGFKPWVLLNDNGLPQLKILACGDSICRGARNSYKGFVGDLGLDYKNIGVGDATISNINTSVTNIPDALIAETAYTPDVIVADGGINDYHYEAALGTIPTSPVTTDADAALLDRSTVMGGAGYLFYQMIKKFPNAQRFFIITHKTQWNTGSAKDGYCPTRQNTQGYTQKDLHDALVAICNVYGVKVIDVYNDSMINSAFSQYRSPTAWSTDSTVAEQYMVDADGVHPTANGYINGYVPLVRQALAIGTK
jgi:hypothetical protein